MLICAIGTLVGCVRPARPRRRASSSTPRPAAARSRHPLVSDALSKVRRYTEYKQTRGREHMTNEAIGWDEGVVQMKLGEKARLDITSDFAYGTQSFPGLIPPNSDLILYVHQAIYNGSETDMHTARSSSRRLTKRIISVIGVAHEQPGIQI
jgi:hypothetical protein